MKKLLLTIAATLVTIGVFAQGTITFNNGSFNKISTGIQGSASSTWTVAPTTLQTFRYGLFYGIGQSTSLTWLTESYGVNSTSVAGIIANPVNNSGTLTGFQIPGTSPNETDVWIQIVGYNSSFGTDWAAAKAAANDNSGTKFFGQTTVVNALALGPATGPGATVWQLATGTNPRQFAGGFAMFTTIPEPTSMALVGMGAAALLIFRRRK